jgi:hypothetical protein
MSILHLIVRRHAMTRAPDRRAQRGCMVPPLLREAAAGAARIPGIAIDAALANDPRHHGSAASDRVEAAASVAGDPPVRR